MTVIVYIKIFSIRISLILVVSFLVLNQCLSIPFYCSHSLAISHPLSMMFRSMCFLIYYIMFLLSSRLAKTWPYSKINDPEA